MTLFTSKASKAERELKALVKDCEIPYFPQPALDLLRLLRDPDGCFEKIADCLQWDTGLVLRVLRTVNSAAFGAVSRIDDVRHAVTFLGRSRLEQLVLALVVKDAVPAESAPGFQAPRFWHAAAFRAALGRSISNKLHPTRTSEVFTAGLLQDIAIPVLAHAQPELYGPVLEAWHREDGRCLSDIETETLGWSHATVGGLLGEAWDLPEMLQRSIEVHHERGEPDREVLPALRLVSLLRETHMEHGIEALVEEAHTDYGLQTDWMTETVEAAEKQARELARTLTS